MGNSESRYLQLKPFRVEGPKGLQGSRGFISGVGV